MFLSERELKETFWKNYNYSSRAKRYQFEVPIREGNKNEPGNITHDAYRLEVFYFIENEEMPDFRVFLFFT